MYLSASVLLAFPTCISSRRAVERAGSVTLVRVRAVWTEVILAGQDARRDQPTKCRVRVAAAVGCCNHNLFSDSVAVNRAPILIAHPNHLVDDRRSRHGQTRSTHGLNNLRDTVRDTVCCVQ